MFDRPEPGVPAGPASVVDPAIIAAAAADAGQSAAADLGAAAQGATPSAALPVPAFDYDRAASDLVETLAMMALPAFPSLANVYTAEVRKAIAAALAPVLRKYRLDWSNLPPELTLALVILPTMPAAAAAIAHDKAKGKTYDHEKTNAQGQAGAGAGTSEGNAPPPGSENPLGRFPTL